MAELPTLHLVTHEFPPTKGGAATYSVEMSRAAARLGYRVVVWVPRSSSADSLSAGLPIEIRALALAGTQGLIDRFRLRSAVRTHLMPRIRPGDTVHLAEIGPLLAAMTFPRTFIFPGARTFITLHGSEIPRFTRSSIWKGGFSRLLNRVDSIHLLSRYNADRLRAVHPAHSEKVVIAPGGSREFGSNPGSELPETGDPDTVHILTTGRLHPRKGQDRFLQYLAALPDSVKPRIHAWIVGPIGRQHYFKKCARLATASGVTVHFIHGCPDSLLPAFYRRADIFTLTSMPHRNSIEGLGLVNLEAASFGLPVVAHDVGGVSETVVHGKTGWIVPHQQPEAFIQSLLSLIESPGKRREFGEASRAFADQHSWENAAHQLYGAP